MDNQKFRRATAWIAGELFQANPHELREVITHLDRLRRLADACLEGCFNSDGERQASHMQPPSPRGERGGGSEC